MAQSFYVSDITIGREGNKISYANDGSMIFSDRYVPYVRLIDLLNNSGGGGGSAAIVREIAVGDWGLDYHDNIYDRDFWSITLTYIGLGISSPDPDKIRVEGKIILSTSPFIAEKIEFDNIITTSTFIKLTVSSKIHCFAIVEPA
jgi:hypothetical protein